MPRFEVISLDNVGRNGNSPLKRTVTAKDYYEAAKQAPNPSTGRIVEVFTSDYDEHNKVATCLVTTNKGTTFKVVVQERYWEERGFLQRLLDLFD